MLYAILSHLYKDKEFAEFNHTYTFPSFNNWFHSMSSLYVITTTDELETVYANMLDAGCNEIVMCNLKISCQKIPP